jgi:hypothetical protein
MRGAKKLSALLIIVAVFVFGFFMWAIGDDWSILRAKSGQQGDRLMDYIPKNFGHLVAVDSHWEQAGSGSSILWFEDQDGTIRLVYVSHEGTVRVNVWNLVKEFPRR